MRNALFGDTITLYNRFRGTDRQDHWQRTVLHGVQVREKIEKTVSTDGKLLVTKSVSITIPVSADAGGRHYLEPHAFSCSESRDGYWTLDAARNLDVVVSGECADELTEDYTLDDLSRDHGYVTIMAVTDNTPRPRLKHWRVVAG